MNIILLEQADWLSHDQVALNDRRYIHLRDILKTDIGAMVKVGMLNGDVGTGEVTSIDNHGARLRVTLGYEATLARGYAVVRGDGHVVTDLSGAQAATALEIEFRDGRLQVGQGAKPKRATKPATPPEQGTLL